MKQLTYFTIFTSIIFLFACNGGNEKKAVDNNITVTKLSIEDSITNLVQDSIPAIIKRHCKNAPGMANFIIDPGTANSMISHFDDTYGKYPDGSIITAIQRKYWVDRCTILKMENFLKRTNAYNGVKFYFAAATQTDASLPAPYQCKTSLYMYPTKPPTVATQIHHDVFDQIVSNICSTTLPYLTEHSITSNQIGVFDKVYYKNSPAPKDSKYSFTKNIWIDTCVIYFMADFLKTFTALDGININTAAYLGTETNVPKGMNPGQQYSTIIFALTVPDKDSSIHNNAFGISKTVYKTFKKYAIENKFFDLTIKPFDLHLNHGELCPQQCE